MTKSLSEKFKLGMEYGQNIRMIRGAVANLRLLYDRLDMPKTKESLVDFQDTLEFRAKKLYEDKRRKLT